MPTAPDNVQPTGLPAAPTAPAVVKATGLPAAPTAPAVVKATGLPAAPSAPALIQAHAPPPNNPSVPGNATGSGSVAAPSAPVATALNGNIELDGVIVGGTIPPELHGFYVRGASINGTSYTRGEYSISKSEYDNSWGFYGPDAPGGGGA